MKKARGWLAGLLVWLAAGCASTGDGPSGALASVTVSGVSDARVRLTLIEVFEGAGYTGVSVYQPEMTFERRGSLGSDIMRGGLLNSKTVERVRIRVLPEGPETYSVQARAWTVQYPGDRLMEDEYAIRRKGPYRKLLEEVAQRAAQTATAYP